MPQRGEPAFAGHHIKTGPPGFARAQVTVRLWMMPRASIEAARPSRRMPPVLRTLSGDGKSWWSGIARTSDGTWTCAFIMCPLLVVIGALTAPPPPGEGDRKSVVEDKRVAVSENTGRRRRIKNNQTKQK